MRLGDVAELVGGRLEYAGDDADIRGVNTLSEAGPHEASFLSNRRYKGAFETSRAGVILLDEQVFPDARRPVIRCRDPYLAFALLQRHFHPEPRATGRRHDSAVIDPTAELAADVDVGPRVVIGARARIGAGTRIDAGCIIEDEVEIGEGCHLRAGAIVAARCVLGCRVILQPGAIIGSDGFGYAWNGREHLKIPQTGRVVLEDDVEIGAGTCIDRGAIGDTVIERGVKLDNLIQIAHNVRVGAYTVMASQVGISGSTRIGKGCQFGGQVGTAGHLTIGEGCRIAAKSGVAGDLEARGVYAGIPAMPHRVWLKLSALLPRLPEVWKQLGLGRIKQ